MTEAQSPVSWVPGVVKVTGTVFSWADSSALASGTSVSVVCVSSGWRSDVLRLVTTGLGSNTRAVPLSRSPGDVSPTTRPVAASTSTRAIRSGTCETTVTW